MAAGAVTMAKDINQQNMKSRKKKFKKQKQKLFRANEPFISVFMWGVNHTVKELSCMRMPLLLMPDDFKAYSKIKIDNHIFNKENLPSHFKVKEYCPVVFKRLRELFGVEDKSYVNSLCVSQPINMMDKGRSGARFLRSFDNKYVIKTLTGEDIAEMHGLLPKYHQYVVEHNCKTLLPHYLGMYRLTLNGTEHYMIVMKNVLSSRVKVHKKYDLKGSTVQREASDKEKRKENPTFKDNDFVKDNVKIYLDDEIRAEFLTTLKSDVEFLASLKLMDYSLLVGIHDSDKAEEELSDNAFDMEGSPPENEHAGLSASESSSPTCKNNNGVNTTLNTTCGDLHNLSMVGSADEDSSYTFPCAQSSPRNEIYYMGLIDILTHYDTRKKAAHAVKTAKHGAGAEISTIHHGQYRQRFVDFISDRVVHSAQTSEEDC